MKKQILIVGITLVLIAVGLSGCTDNNNSLKSNDQKILGQWNAKWSTGSEYIWGFYSNGSYVESNPSGNYATWYNYAMTDDKLVLSNKNGGNIATCEYSFSNNDNKLTLLTDWGATLILTR
jgi:hypothetical protein